MMEVKFYRQYIGGYPRVSVYVEGRKLLETPYNTGHYCHLKIYFN